MSATAGLPPAPEIGQQFVLAYPKRAPLSLSPAMILKTVLRDGFEYTEWFVRQVNEGEADLEAGRVLSTAEVLSLIERQRDMR